MKVLQDFAASIITRLGGVSKADLLEVGVDLPGYAREARLDSQTLRSSSTSRRKTADESLGRAEKKHEDAIAAAERELAAAQTTYNNEVATAEAERARADRLAKLAKRLG